MAVSDGRDTAFEEEFSSVRSKNLDFVVAWLKIVKAVEVVFVGGRSCDFLAASCDNHGQTLDTLVVVVDAAGAVLVSDNRSGQRPEIRFGLRSGNKLRDNAPLRLFRLGRAALGFDYSGHLLTRSLFGDGGFLGLARCRFGGDKRLFGLRLGGRLLWLIDPSLRLKSGASASRFG